MARPLTRSPKRTDAQKASDRVIIAEMYLKQMRLVDIAAEMTKNVRKMSFMTVSRDVQAIKKEWLECRTTNMEQATMMEVRRLDTVERTFWQGWMKSLENKGKDDDVATGNPKFLDGVLRCIAARSQLLGLEAPSRIEVQAEINAKIEIRTKEATAEEVARYQESIEKAIHDGVNTRKQVELLPDIQIESNGHKGSNGANGNGNVKEREAGQ